LANRIVGNVIIVDSAMGNGLMLASANQVVSIDTFFVNSVVLFQADTTALIEISELNTSNAVIKLNRILDAVYFSTPQKFTDLKIPVLTAGTAYIYLA
jgi:hypothetical protein